MPALVASLRLALRRLRRAPGYALAVVGILALGFGATAAVLGVADAAVLRPFPYRDPGALVDVLETFNNGEGSGGASWPNFRDWRAGAPAFDGLTAHMLMPATLAPARGAQEARPGADRVRAAVASADLFAVLGASAHLGRAFRPGDGAPVSAPVVVLSDALWRTRFGADPAAVGRTVRLNDSLFTVVGVMPAEFRFPAEGAADLWVPYDPTPAMEDSRGSHSWTVVGRLRPGVTLQTAQAQLEQVAARLALAYPAQQARRSVRTRPLRDAVSGAVRPTLLALAAAAALVLAIAVANVANLALARAAAGRREAAVRVALGAGRWQLARDGLAEAALLAAGAALVGALAARVGFGVLGRAAGDALPLSAGLRLGPAEVLALAGAGVLVTAMLAATPLLDAVGWGGGRSAAPRAELSAGGARAGITARERRAQSGLVVAQTGLSLALLVGAAVLLRTVAALRGTPLGLAADGVLTAHVPVPNTRPGGAGPTATFLRPVLDRLRATSGVGAAGAISMLPLQTAWSNGDFTVEGAPPPAGNPPLAEHRIVSPGYFGAMRIPLLAGRDVAERVPLPATPDSAGQANTPCEVVVNAALARRYLTGGGPLDRAVGRRLLGIAPAPCTVVGVAGDVRQASLGIPPLREIYFPYGMFDAHTQGADEMVFVVRSALPPAAAVRAVREAVRAVDPGQPVYRVQTMADVVDASLADRRLYAGVLGAFGATALALAAAGVYAVLAYAVARRRREMGVRMALGARATDVVRLVVREGAVLAGLGVAAGAVGAGALTRALRGVLYGVTATDPVSFVAAAAVLGGAALLAAWLPARRAARVDPAVALRSE